MMAYAKGARTFERHIDIEEDGIPVSPYCTLPHQADAWFKAWDKAREMCGPPGTQKRLPPEREIRYLDSLVRGVYATRDLPEGHAIADDDVYLAVPLLKGQISCRELMRGEVLTRAVLKDAPIDLDAIDSPYAKAPGLLTRVRDRGLDRS